jgi:hypothetical protein
MELRNALTRAQLDILRPQPLIVDFSFSDVPGSLSLGIVPLGHLIPSCVIEIYAVFDGAVTITVGDIVAQGRFQAIADNKPLYVGVYETQPHYEYSSDTEVFVFLSGSPTIGRGRAILYIE